MTIEQREAVNAVSRIIAAPGIGRYGHRITAPGDPRRRERVFPALVRVWYQHRCLDVDPTPYIGKAHPPNCRLVRKAS